MWGKLWKSISQKTLNYSFVVVVVVLFIIHARRTVHFEMFVGLLYYLQCMCVLNLNVLVCVLYILLLIAFI